MAGVLLVAPGWAVAQVTVDPAALRQLAGVVPPPPLQMVAPAPVVAHHWTHFHRRVTAAVASPKSPAPVQTAARVTAPPVPKPAPVAPKPAAPVSLVFAPGSADLPGNAVAALKPFCTAPGQVAIDARAPTDPSDPSAAMRLSLSRALAVQQVLAACGVPGTKILPRALGDVPGQNEDETVVGGGAKE